MTTQSRRMDQRIIAGYTDQPPALPAELRARIEAAWGGAPVQLYALADLDDQLRLAGTWAALGPALLALEAMKSNKVLGWDPVAKKSTVI